MKKKLLLYLSKLNSPGNVLRASTLAWLCKSKGYLFDNYYDSYHQGVHFPGGDSRTLEVGQQTGGMVSGDRHFEELYFMLLNFDVSVISFGDAFFLNSIKNLGIPVVTVSDQNSAFYIKAFSHLGIPLPHNVVMIGSGFGKILSGLDAYLYPEIYYRQAIGVHDSISEEELKKLCQEGCKIYCIYVNEHVIGRLLKKGYDIEIIDSLKGEDDYFSVTNRLACRWKEKARGWILGDPLMVCHWIPKACEEDLIAVYSTPQERIISESGDIISSKGRIIYGRQYNDRDFFELSKINQCLQVIDPCRPPFQSITHAQYFWDSTGNKEGFCEPEYSDEELREFARKNKILISLMFWSGMIREVTNFYNLMDLFAITRLRCGLVVTAQSYEYMMHSPFELLTIPLDQGGVYPLVEPVLGSCGIGVGIEFYMERERLRDDLEEGLSRIFQKVKNERYIPKGWWATMDANMEKLRWWKRPKPFCFLRYPPYFQIRFHPKEKNFKRDTSSHVREFPDSIKQDCIDNIKKGLRRLGLEKYFIPYRPYEFYQSGPVESDIINTVKSVGLKYMFTKSGFNSYPDAKYIDKDFIALNYTAGQWDGWTPFETINDVSDLRRSEKMLLKRNKPGWIVSTVDSCLWTFSGEFWKRANKLYEIAQFCAKGGKSGKLINTKPITISRYARIITEEKI